MRGSILGPLFVLCSTALLMPHQSFRGVGRSHRTARANRRIASAANDEESGEDLNELDVLGLKDREAQILAELQSISAAKRSLLRERTLSIGIVGFGKFGQFLARRFLSQGHTVTALSRAPYSQEAKELGVPYFGGLAVSDDDDLAQEERGPWRFLAQEHLDVVVFAVSIVSFEQTIKSLPLHLLAIQPHGPRTHRAGTASGSGGVLLVDVLSVKEHPRAVLQQLAPPTCDVLCTHPMFGPESGSGSWQGLPFVYERVQGRCANRDCVERFLSIFETEGCKMEEMCAEEHDRDSANSQFATHLVGRLLEQLDLKSTRIDTKGFQRMLALKDTVADDSFDLFYGLYKYNPNSIDTLLLLRQALVGLEMKLVKLDKSDMGTVGWKLQADATRRTSKSNLGAAIPEDLILLGNLTSAASNGSLI